MALNVCEIRGLEKAFGPNRVLRSIDMDLPEGQVTVLMGANGAGKSTLVKVLCGVHRADGGAISMFGAPFEPVSPADAFAKGVVTVHQSINDGVVPDLDVASNLMLDQLSEPGTGLFLQSRALRAEARKIAASMGIEVDVRTPVAELGVADRQMIAIARAMARDPKVLILDEPTSSLSAAEAERLFQLILRLRETGVAILYISHRMSDIRAIADRIVSMRDGEISGVFEGENLDYEAAVTAMLGHAMTEVDVSVAKAGATVLAFDQVALAPGSPALSLEVGQGEVVAITGLLGSGKSLLASMLFGLGQPASGEIRLDGRPFRPASPRAAIRAGIHMSPKDRASNAVIPDFDIEGNLTLPFLRRFSNLSFTGLRRQRSETDRMIETLGIVCQGHGDGIGTLSGGNQQKVIVGRWLLEPCRLLVLDEPFQGVDIRARRDIGAYIRATAETRATLVFVAEIDEALEIADRIVVMHERDIVGTHINDNVDPSVLLAQVSGQSSEQPGAH